MHRTNLNTQWGPWIIPTSDECPDTSHLPRNIRMQAVYINFRGVLRNDATENYDRSPYHHHWMGRDTLAYRWEVLQNDHPTDSPVRPFQALDPLPSGDPNPFEFQGPTWDAPYYKEYEFSLGGKPSLIIAQLVYDKIYHVWDGEFRMRQNTEDAFDFVVPMSAQQVVDFRELIDE